MPTYRNETEKRITYCDVGYMEWRPGEERRLPFFVPHGNLGLTLVSDDPLVEAAVRDWTVELSPHDPAELELPYYEAFELSVYCVSGNASIYIGKSDVPIGVNDSESHFSSYTYARCPSLKLVSAEGAVLHVKQEERNTKNTLRRGNY